MNKLRVDISPLGTLESYRFTVIFARLRKTGGGWLYSRHKLRDTWETAGGHVEPGETPLDCAKRELYEETGAVKFYICPAFDYSVHAPAESSCGQVFFADIEELSTLPPEHEMAEVKAFETVPDKMTYPDILPVLFAELQRWLGLDKPSDEYWDVLDKDRCPTGRLHRRGDPLPDGDYHLVVRAWIANSRGEFLITRRAFNKIGYPGVWETPAGSALAGEDSLTATIREAEEECGIALLPENAELLLTYCDNQTFYDVRLFRQEFNLADVALQDGETIDAKIASVGEIAAMIERGEFIDRNGVREFEILEE